jgi:hypothetical protein
MSKSSNRQASFREATERFENQRREIQRVRSERITTQIAKIIKTLESQGKAVHVMNRSWRRLGGSGMPRSRIFSERMKIPKGKPR